jgi:membrane protease YdiL (CAAX protease family)
VAGILLALLYECSGSLLLPILFHLGNNLLALSLHFGLPNPSFFLIVGIATALTLPLFLLSAKRHGVPLPPKEEQPPSPLRDLFLSPVLLYLLIILSIILLPTR